MSIRDCVIDIKDMPISVLTEIREVLTYNGEPIYTWDPDDNDYSSYRFVGSNWSRGNTSPTISAEAFIDAYEENTGLEFEL